MTDTSNGSKQTPESPKGAFIGGIIGAVATALVGGAIAAFAFAGNAITSLMTAAVLNHLEVTTHDGHLTRPGNYFASCEKDEIPVGGACIVSEGSGGMLQNQGTQTTPSGGYFCTYAGSVPVTVYAACLKRKQ